MNKTLSNILKQWDASISLEQQQQMDERFSRRSFLTHSTKAAAGLSILPGLAFLTSCDQQPAKQQQTLSQQEPWNTFAAVQQILFPDDDNGPSAKDLNATAYLKFILDANDTDSEDREFILKGISWLNQLSQTEHKQNFTELNSKQQPIIIHKIAKSSSGERWLSLLLLYIFEALLTDPAYGANPNGIGWQWLEHQPGFPSPSQDKIYPELQKR